MSSPLHFELLTQTADGQVRFASAGCSENKNLPGCSCVQIQFGRFVWQFPRQNLENLYGYICSLCSPEGFAKNAYTDQLAVVAMSGHIMMGLFTRAELQALQSLLQQARLALLQRDFASTSPLQPLPPTEN